MSNSGDKFGQRKVKVSGTDDIAVGGTPKVIVLLAVFFAVAALSFVLLGGVKPANLMRAITDLVAPHKSNYISSAASCEQGWVPRAQNDTQLLCFLTTHVERLCNPLERSHLAYIYNAYQTDRAKYYSDVSQRSARSSAELQGLQTELQEAVRKNFDNVKTNIEGHSVKMNDDEMANIIKRMKSAALGGPDGERAEDVRRVPDAQIITALRTVAQQGLIGRLEFGWFPDATISAAFDGLEVSKSQCKI